MEIKSVRLSDVGRFEELDIQFAPTSTHRSKITVLMGRNGSGKTTVLKSLNICLSWLIARIRSGTASGMQLPTEDIRNDAPGAVVSIGITDLSHPRASIGDDHRENELFVWGCARSREGRVATAGGAMSEIRLLADHYRTQLTADEGASLPLIAYYPSERRILDISLKTSGKQAVDQFDGYDNRFNGGVDLHDFFGWFREREDSENEDGIPDAILAQIAEKFGSASEVWQTLSNLEGCSRDPQLTAVRSAIAALMPGFTNLRVHRSPHLHMTVEKHGATLNVTQLSQGEKSLFALVGDIARRLTITNPSMDNPLHGNGIILIDEVDLHLHPQWHLNLIARLRETFPNCQFVLTTHSPTVIDQGTDALVHLLDDGEFCEPKKGLEAIGEK